MRRVLNLLAVIEYHTRSRNADTCWDKHERGEATASITFATTIKTKKKVERAAK